jgi:hypothetical protein
MEGSQLEGASRADLLQLLEDQLDRAEVSQQEGKGRRRRDRRSMEPVEVDGCYLRSSVIGTSDKRFQPMENAQMPTMANRVGQDEVVGNGGDDAQQFDRRADQHKAVIVIVDVSAREPRIIRREGRALDDRVEVREIHRALAALGGMPEVRVAEADDQVERKKARKRPSISQEVFAFRPAIPRAVRRAVVGKRRAERTMPEDNGDRRARIGNACRAAIHADSRAGPVPARG